MAPLVDAAANWRRERTVLVTDAQAIGSVAVIRSLGRAGYRVLASSGDRQALGFHSRFCAATYAQPDDAGAVDDWLAALIESESVGLVVPSEGFLLSLRPSFAKYRHLLPVPADELVAYGCLSKCDLFSRCAQQGLGEALAPHRLVVRGQPMPSVGDLVGLGAPLFVKADAVHALQGDGSVVLRCETAAAACAKLEPLLERYDRLLVQGYVPGVGVGAFLSDWNGQRLAEFMHRRLHEVPHTGGASSYRRSWHNDLVLADARARMACLGWQGVGMFEYRWHPASGRFHLVEFNSRFWGSLHLALYAGVDFPRLLADAFFGRPAPARTSYRDVRSRLTFPGEIAYVLSCLRDPALKWPQRAWPPLEFFMLGMNPAIRSDLLFPGDRGLYWRSMRRSVAKFLR